LWSRAENDGQSVLSYRYDKSNQTDENQYRQEAASSAIIIETPALNHVKKNYMDALLYLMIRLFGYEFSP
jgi:hypothetical protein